MMDMPQVPLKEPPSGSEGVNMAEFYKGKSGMDAAASRPRRQRFVQLQVGAVPFAVPGGLIIYQKPGGKQTCDGGNGKRESEDRKFVCDRIAGTVDTDPKIDDRNDQPDGQEDA